MTDKELLERAAKAAGIDLVWNDAECPGYYSDWRGMPQWEYWNPLSSDGCALRLAVKLGLLIDCDDELRETDVVLIQKDHADQYVHMTELYGDDPCAATRRAIVRAAAMAEEEQP